jgi:hypothetical protein
MIYSCIGVLRGLNRHVEREFDSTRKDTHCDGSLRGDQK